MHPVRRRKKRPSNGIRTIEVCRGSNGFGFTISGQQPCLLSSIVRDSPAERAGLRSGDYLVSVNGQNVSKVSHDDVVRLIGSSSGLLKLQIAENYYSDSSDDDHLVSVRSKPKHAHKTRNTGNRNGQQNRIAKVVRDLRSGVMFDKYEAETAALAAAQGVAEESWQLPDLPPPRYHPFLGQPKEELCFFLGYLGTIEMPKLIQPGSRSQVVRCCVKRMRAEKRSHTWVVMRVHAEGVTLTGAGGSLLADYPVHRICYCGPSADEDRKYVGLITSSGGPQDGDATPSSSCHIFAVQSSLADHEKHASKVVPFKISCTSGPLSDGCFEFPSTSESVLNAVRSFCLTKDEEHQDNELVMANSPQPSQAGSTAASSNSDSGIGFRDDCGNQSDRIVMVDIENQRLHIQQLCDDGKTLDIQLAGSRARDTPSANLQQAFACVSALCPLAGELDPAELSQRLTVRHLPPDPKKCGCDGDLHNCAPWLDDDSVFHRLGIHHSDYFDSSSCHQSKGEPYAKPGMNQTLSVSYGDGDVVVRNAMESKSSRSIYFQSTDSFDVESYKLSPKVFGLPRPLLTQSMEELATPPPPAPPQLWGSLQNLPLHSFTNASEAIDDKEDKQSNKNEETVPDNAISFEKLVADPFGMEMFTEFLKKEFSEENMTFWKSCEEYAELTDLTERRRLARAIFDAHLAEGAPEPVNVDAHARQHALNLDCAPPDLFVAAQKQVFNLMKFDSFPRFLKSDLYQDYLGENRKLKKSQSDAEDRRRKSLLPWARKCRSKSKDHSEADLHLTLQRKNSEDAVSIGSRSSLTSWDAALRGSLSRQSLVSRDGDGSNALVRIVLADGATAVVQLRPGESVRELMERVLAKRGLSYKAFEVYSLVNNKMIALDEDSSSLANHQVRLEQRVMFRLDLPNRKTVSVKAKATKTLVQVLRPVLHKYNYPIEMVTICSVSENTVLELSVPISAVDGRRLTVLTRSPSTMPNMPPPTRTYVRAGTSLDEITNKVFEEVLQGKSSCGSSAAGSVRSETSSSTIPLPLPRFLRRDSAMEKLRLRGRKSGKVGACGSDSDDLYEGLKRAQRSRLEDQRGTEINFELPEFLKDKENSPQSVRKMRKLRQDGSINAESKEAASASALDRPEPQDDKANSCLIRGQLQTARSVTCKTYETTTKSKSPIMFADENDKQSHLVAVKQTPPPLPPKPKLYNLPKDAVLRNHNLIKPIAKLNRSRRAAYLDQTAGSFV